MSIGDVLKSLREEFPEVTVSKIRFLEAEGLIEHERTPSGYRKFYQQDLARVRYIRRIQRDNFMPLKITRRKLEQFEVDGAEAVSQPSRSRPDDRVAPAEPPLPPISAEDDLDTPVGGLHLSFAGLLPARALPADHIREIAPYGLLAAHPIERSSLYYADALVIAT